VIATVVIILLVNYWEYISSILSVAFVVALIIVALCIDAIRKTIALLLIVCGIAFIFLIPIFGVMFGIPTLIIGGLLMFSGK